MSPDDVATKPAGIADPWPAPFDKDELAGRVCLVTGAARGMGAAFARNLAAHGAQVVMTDISYSDVEAGVTALNQAGHKAMGLPLDVRDSHQVEWAAAEIERTLGPIDILINNAGLCVIRPSLEVSDDEWALHLDVMLTGPFKVSRRVGAKMVQRQSGCIVNICSIAGFGGWPQRAAYNSAKGGLKALTEVLAAEWAPQNVRVNAIAPGVTRTELTDKLIADSGGSVSLDLFESRTPMGRVGEMQEMADAVLFLVSDRSAHITGQTLPVDGGWLASDGFPTSGGAVQL